MKSFKYDRGLKTGFGDRISVLLNVAAAAATVNAHVFVWWHEGRKERAYHADMSLAEVNMRIIWPSNLHVLSREEFDRKTYHLPEIEYNAQGLLASDRAFDGVYTTAWKTMRLPTGFPRLERDSFENSFRSVCKQLQIKNTFQHRIPDIPYTVLHIRGGDKESPKSEFNTNLVLGKLNTQTLLVVTDDVAYMQNILSDRRNNSLRVLKISTTPNISDKYDALFLDFSILLGAQAIIQHSPNAWSALSNIASMISQIPLMNTWTQKNSESKYVGTLASVQIEAGCPSEFYSSNRPDQIINFLQQLPRQHLVFPRWVVVVSVSHGYDDMFLNWLYWYNELQMDTQLIVVAEDNSTLQKYKACLQFTVMGIDLQESSGPLTYRSTEYNKLVSKRPRYLLDLLQLHKHLIYTDIDTVWKNDPRPFLTGNFDIWAYNDHLSEVCSGFIGIRSSPETLAFFRKWIYMLKVPQTNQKIFSDLLKSENMSARHLDTHLFTPGNVYFDDAKNNPSSGHVVIHNNWIIGLKRKTQRFMEHQLWHPMPLVTCSSNMTL